MPDVSAVRTGGREIPNAIAKPTFVTPATNPLMAAIWKGSDNDTLRVKLLSMAQHKQAPRIASGGQTDFTESNPDHDSTTVPATIAAMPRAIRLSKFSRKTNQARSAVRTPSALRRSEAVEAVVPNKPHMRSTGPATPPKATAPSIHRQSLLVSGAPFEPRRNLTSIKPTPEPRYNSPARSHGPTSSNKIFAAGVLAPKRTAAPRAAAIPLRFVNMAVNISDAEIKAKC